MTLVGACAVCQVPVTGQHCEVAGCTVTSSYGYPGDRRRVCSTHKLDGMVSQGSLRSNLAHFCAIGRPIGTGPLLQDHHQTYLVVLVQVYLYIKRCEACSLGASYGLPGEGARFCVTHRLKGMVGAWLLRALLMLAER